MRQSTSTSPLLSSRSLWRRRAYNNMKITFWCNEHLCAYMLTLQTRTHKHARTNIFRQTHAQKIIQINTKHNQTENHKKINTTIMIIKKNLNQEIHKQKAHNYLGNKKSNAHTFLLSQIVCLDPARRCFLAASSTSPWVKSIGFQCNFGQHTWRRRTTTNRSSFLRFNSRKNEFSDHFLTKMKLCIHQTCRPPVFCIRF